MGATFAEQSRPRSPGRMGKTYAAVWIGVLCVSVLSSCSKPPAVRQQLTLGMPREPLCALMAIAVGQGFFEAEGLDVTIDRSYPSGKRALGGLLDGKIQLTASAEVPIVFRSFDCDDFRVVATIGSSDNEPKIVARADQGIAEPADLRGRRIATQEGSAVHYYLHLFLLQHGLTEADVELSFMKAEELPTALAEGKIDAFSMREPYVGEAQALLGENARVFAEPGLYVKTFNLVARPELLEQQRETVEAALRALVRAEQFAIERPDEAKKVVAQQLAMEAGALDDVWDQIDLRVSLGQELLSGMEDEARWSLKGALIEAEGIPNYLRLIDADCLKRVRPKSVTIIQ
jgi:sulfonate transport system substrate-binding protein